MEQIEHCLSFYLGKAYQRVTQSARQRLGVYGCTVCSAQSALGAG